MEGASAVLQNIFVETQDAFLGCVIDYREQRLDRQLRRLDLCCRLGRYTGINYLSSLARYLSFSDAHNLRLFVVID